MNEEHIELIRLMNLLFDHNQSGREKFQLLSDIRALEKWTVKHFDHEEQYMESIGFPGLKSHKLIHKKLLTDLGSFQEEFKSSPDKTISQDFFNFLKLWLQAHIMGIDMKYGDFAKAA